MKTFSPVLFVFALAAFGADVPKAPVPLSPYLGVVYRFAEALLEHGRDTYGPQKSGLLLSALDRATLRPMTNRPPAPAGIREGDRVGAKSGPLVGANPQHDENLLRLLYTLSDLSGQRKYRDAAEAGLKWFLQNAASPATHLLPWGEHLSWDVRVDEPISKDDRAVHEFFRPWMLWKKCFELAPAASRQFALALWQHQIADQQTGAFNRHAGFWQHAVADGMDFPRHAGFYIRTWAAAYAQTRDETFLKAIEVLLGRFESKRHPDTGLIESYSGQTSAWPASTLSLAIDCDGAAHDVTEPLASRLRAFAAREDEVFCGLPHDLKGRGGFVTQLEKSTAKPAGAVTPLWDARYGGYTTAQMALMCVARYENNGQTRYRELISAAAAAYLESLPPEETDVWPMTFGHAISLQLAAWRSTARPIYLERARQLADRAVAAYWPGATPPPSGVGPAPQNSARPPAALPRASLKTDHYETITGADTLALALVELHLHILHITAVRCPANTLDR